MPTVEMTCSRCGREEAHFCETLGRVVDLDVPSHRFMNMLADPRDQPPATPSKRHLGIDGELPIWRTD